MRKIYFDGNVLVKVNVKLRTRKDLTIYSEKPKDAQVINCPGGIIEINEDFGSFLADIYVKGGFTCYENVLMAPTDLSRIYEMLLKNTGTVENILGIDIPEELKKTVYMQQFIFLRSAVELYLYSLIAYVLGKDEKYYDNIINGYSAVSCCKTKKKFENIINGKDCYDLKLSRITDIIESIFYNHVELVGDVYNIILDIDIRDELNKLFPSEYNKIRNDIAHRCGYKPNGVAIDISIELINEYLVRIKENCKSIYDKLTKTLGE